MKTFHSDRLAAAMLALVAGLAFGVFAVWLGVQAYLAPAMLGQIGYGLGALAVCGIVEGCMRAAWETLRGHAKAAGASIAH